ncbi:Uu.00g065780.m01.CDS01 [Anthostomella pinea]|uniref:Uu.00g065780.m01.CDS01 n=1 Tax=Anthostomella pinea TaxID=933095 RepID=A0AAI8YN71_9PEZI|nr:Uu.00g065780.m01.CDS01 [Anthostomella pinea]
MKTMIAIKATSFGRAEIVSDVAIPFIEDHPGYVLVKTNFVGINHCDHQFIHHPVLFNPGLTISAEFSGLVMDAEQGSTRLKIGDRVAGYTFPSGDLRPNAGAYAKFLLVKADALLCVVEEWAATWHWTGPVMFEEGSHGRRTILIYGGATTTGRMAVQLAKLSGLRVIATCSPVNFELVTQLGANEAFDYHDARRCAGDILSVDGEVELVLDCVGGFESPQICVDAMAAGGAYYSVTPTPSPRTDAKSSFVAGNKVLGESSLFLGSTFPRTWRLSRVGRKFVPLVEKLIAEGLLKLRIKELGEWNHNVSKYVAQVTGKCQW